MNELDLPHVLQDFAINIVAITILAFFIYYRRHRRRDTTIGYVATNLSLFVVSAALSSSTTLNVGVGFGLFAVLSIVRLRSDEATQSEIGYTMVSLVIGLMTGLPGLGTDIKIVFSTLLVLAMLVIDHPLLIKPQRYQRVRIEIDRVIKDENELHRFVEEKISAKVKKMTVLEIDLVRETMRVDVRADT